MAKLFKVKVNEFALGMGPKLWSKQKGDTLYALRLFPIGGYVAMEGEDEESADENSLCKKNPWQRLGIVVAGAVMNLILGYIIMVTLTIMSGGVGTTIISRFDNNAVSSKYLQVNDKILSVNGSKVRTPNDVTFEFLRSKDGIIDIEVERNGKKVKLPDIQFEMDDLGNGVKAIHLDFKVYGEKLTFLNTITYSFNWAVTMAKQVWLSLFDLLTGRFGFNQLSGPVGVASAISEASSMGIDQLLLMVAFITINLGVFNLLPIPALDGGRIVFIILEIIRGKPVPQKYEAYVHTAGMVLLLALMVFVTVNDVVKIFKGMF